MPSCVSTTSTTAPSKEVTYAELTACSTSFDVGPNESVGMYVCVYSACWAAGPKEGTAYARPDISKDSSLRLDIPLAKACPLG